MNRDQHAPAWRTLPPFVCSCLLLLSPGVWTTSAQPYVSVLTHHNDNARTGQNLNETTLTPENVNAASFGKLFSQAVDGFVYAQPLYMAAVPVPGKGTRNLLFVATEHNSVYAFDADRNEEDATEPLWHVNFNDPANGVTPVPIADLGLTPEVPELGITGTPVIDPDTETLYVVARFKIARGGTPTYAKRLYALDVRTGENRPGSPVDIQASVQGAGIGSLNGMIAFDFLYQFQRPGLLLLNGVVYIGFSGTGNIGSYHGWILGYDAESLQPLYVFNNTPNGDRGGIWMSGAGLAADAEGNIYCSTGNGTFSAHLGGIDYGDSILKLKPEGGSLTVLDYFTPYNQALLEQLDADLGSGGVVLLPDSVGSPEHRRLAVTCGKNAVVYLVDRDNMGHFNAVNDSHALQEMQLGGPAGTWSTAAYFDGWIYYWGINDIFRAFTIANGQMSRIPVSQSSVTFGYPGATPAISANGTNNAIAWAIRADAFPQGGPAVLYAFDARNLGRELYNSSQAGQRDRMGLAQKFSVPTIANGKVYVGTGFGVSAFGNIGAPILTMQPESQTIESGAEVTFLVAANGTPPLRYQWQFNGADLAGATNSWLTLANVQRTQTGSYTAVVRNASASATSATADLLVQQAAVPPQLLIGQNLELTLQGETGRSYQIQYTADLDLNPYAWIPVTVVTLTNSAQTTVRLDASNEPQRYFRATVITSF